MTGKKALALHHYTKFECIGSSCEDSCCGGWQIAIDKATYLAYKENKDPTLSKLFSQTIKLPSHSTGIHDFALIVMDADNSCPFLDAQNLCRIHKEMGHAALSTTCSSYPRTANLFGNEFEYSLTLSCPEAARQILLDPEPIHFVEVTNNAILEQPTALLGKLSGDALDDDAIANMNDLRAVIVAILQIRTISLEARLLLLGRLLAESESAMQLGPQGISKQLPNVLGKYVQMLPHAHVIQEQIEALRPNPVQRLRLFQTILTDLQPDIQQPVLKRCFDEACRGLSWKPGESSDDSELIALHEDIYRKYLGPFLVDHPFVLENLLIHHAFRSLFPFRGNGLSSQYRELVSLYLISHTFLLGLSGYRQATTREMIIEFFYSFFRLASHSKNYLGQVADSLEKRLGIGIGDLAGLMIVRDKS
ncbi:MAG: flagellin lysine-N-methylase [Dechloromonas sp.]|jgi:lysine-N-methylase|nr:flagellin lysine-N-methylase [Dechloromonas sp.]